MSSLHYEPAYCPGEPLAGWAGMPPTVDPQNKRDYTLIPKRHTCSPSNCFRHANSHNPECGAYLPF